jgi:hypothetical protein
MTPKKKTSNSTTLKMERKRIINSSNGGDAKVHVAGGTQFIYQIEDLVVYLLFIQSTFIDLLKDSNK